MPGGDVGHYDRSGRSADKLLVRRPLRDGRLNTPLGLQRHPIPGTTHMHTGVDWDAPLASAIVAAGAEHGHPPNHGADRRLRRRILPRRMRAHNADPACGHHALTVARPPLTMIAAMERRRVARGRKQ